MRIKEFNRLEIKYVIYANQIADIVNDLMPYMELDPYATTSAGYRITSLYYDTSDFQCYWQKLDGTNYRRKLRVRIYGDTVRAEQNAFVEIKEKSGRVTRKRRMDLPYALTETFCTVGELPDECITEKDQALVDEIRHITYAFQIQPSCVVSYDRLPLNGHSDYNHDLRVTFDTNMRGRTYDLSLTSRCDTMPYFMPPTRSILEVKVDKSVPQWLLGILGKHRLASTPVSKYAFTMLYGSTTLVHQRTSTAKVLTRYG